MHIPAAIRKHPIITAVSAIVLLPTLGFALWTTIALHYSYSTNDRAGLLQKVSKRGWLCKTWEGELQLNVVPGAAPEKFAFTTRSDSIAAVLNSATGRNVVLTYAEHLGIPGTCFGETDYFVTGVRTVP